MDDARALRARLEAAQGEVKRLTRALEEARAPRTTSREDTLTRDVARLEALVAHAKESRRQQEAHWKEREGDWQVRERALKDQVDALRREVKATERQLERVEARAGKLDARVKQLQVQRPAPKVLATLQGLLSGRDHRAEVQLLLREVARLKQKLSLQQPRLRR